MSRAISYIRFSSLKQEKGNTEERQEESIEAYCQQKGWAVTERLKDKGESAWKGNHLKDAAALGSLANRVRSGQIEQGTILVVENLDRLSRQAPIDVFQWMVEMANHGLRIATVRGDRMFDQAKLHGHDAVFAVMEVIWEANRANSESEVKSQRVRSAWQKKHQQAAAGHTILTTLGPGWLKAKPDRSGWDLIPDRVSSVQWIFQLVADGYGIARVAKTLNEEGRKHWGRTGKGFSQTHIIRTIDGPAAEGDYIPFFHGGSRGRSPNPVDRIVGYYPRIVDADLVERARESLRSRKGRGGPTKDTYPNLFLNVARCSVCGGTMTATKGPVWNDGVCTNPGFVTCTNHRRGIISDRTGVRCPSKKFFQYQPFETAALDAMLHLALEPSFFQQPDQMLNASRAHAEAKKRVSDIQGRLTNIMTMIERAADPELLLQRYDALTAELRLAQADEKEAEAAKGAVSPAEHLMRLAEIRDLLMDPDPYTRHSARRKVTQAINAIVDVVFYDGADTHRGKPERTITLVMLKGAHSIKFDNRGHIIKEVNLSDQIEASSTAPMALNLRNAITGGDEAAEAKLKGYLKRKAQPA